MTSHECWGGGIVRKAESRGKGKFGMEMERTKGADGVGRFGMEDQGNWRGRGN